MTVACDAAGCHLLRLHLIKVSDLENMDTDPYLAKNVVTGVIE